ncbi:hypothetical protein [Geotalea toluenoxydans]
MKNTVEYPVSRRADSRSKAIWYVLPALVLPFLLQPVTGFSEELPRDTGYLFALAVADKPTVHGVGERIRIAKGLEPDRIAEFNGVHEAVSFPGDTDPDADDFKEEAYGQLRAEIRMTFAELSSVRARIEVIKQSLELLRRMVLTSTGLYGEGKLDQGQALQAQLEWEKLVGNLQFLEKREKIYSIRMNVLTGAPTENSVPILQPLQEYRPDFDSRTMMESYRSRRFLELFQQLIRQETQPTGEGLHGSDSLDVEADAFITVVRISLESLYQQARRYRTSIIPKAELAHSIRLELYKNGKQDFSSLIEGLLYLCEMRSEYQALLGEAHGLKARVEYLTGVVID